MSKNQGRELLTPEERERFTRIPPDISEWELGASFTLTPYDLKIINQRRRDHNRLGFAVQLCVLRYTGWPLNEVKIVPPAILQYLASQIGVKPNVFNAYSLREPTHREHMQEIRDRYGYENFTATSYERLSRHLHSFALANANSSHLLQTALDTLRKWKTILPSIITIERLVWETRKRADETIFGILGGSLTPEQVEKLEMLLTPMPESNNKTYLSWLKEFPGRHSPDMFLKVIERLEYIRKLKLEIDTKDIHSNRLRQLSRIGGRYEPYALRRFDKQKRHAMLIAYLLDLTQNLVDQAFEIHDRQIRDSQSKGRKAQEEIQKKNGKSINEKVIHFASLGKALIKARNEGIDPFVALETVMPWDSLVASVAEAEQLSRPIDYDYLDLLDGQYNRLRRYTPLLLSALEFRFSKSTEPLMRALNVIREMNATGRRKVPDDAPLDFIPKRWRNHVLDSNDSINRHYYEMAALTELRNCVRSGDISIAGSRQHKDFDEYLISQEEWAISRNQGTRLAVPLSVEEYLDERTSSLAKRLEWINKNADALEGISIEDSRLHVSRLDRDTPDEAKSFSRSLYAMLPRIKLTDLLLEVCQWTGFEMQFIHASTSKPPHPDERAVILAALIAMGTNIGLTKMAEATPEISYRQMANVAQWRMHEEVMNRAQATLVNFHHKLGMSAWWGDGTTSSSDGMRMQIGVSSLHADANPHYGFGKGATIYRFTSDQFSAFYTKVINTNARDAVHIIDGLLHHETDLVIEEHYTDTAGYTDQVFGLTHVLGFRFAPRLRDLGDSKLYVIGKADQYSKIETLLRGQIDMKSIRDNYDDVLRLAHSIREGRASAALIMGKLGSYARQNRLAKALREMGRIEKTIFIMDYISSKAMRRKIQKGLNKGEAMNSLARAIFFGKHGEFREKALQDQLQRASALNILINAIIVWNTVYLGQAFSHYQEKNIEHWLPYISPLGWEHINLLGEYVFDQHTIISLDSLRPLNLSGVSDT